MTTIRQANRKRYVSISNDLAQNNSLSLRARGLILYLLSLPDDWKIHINHLRKVLKEGERTIVATINELKDANYIKFHKMGFKEGWHYFVFEAPIQEDAFKEFLRTTAVCEDFANAKSCRNAPPLQKTNSNLQRNNSSTEGKPSHTPQTPTTSPLLPLTKEEEGLFAQRMKEIPKPPKYKSLSYKRKVLDSLREEGIKPPPPKSIINKRILLANSYDMKRLNGMDVRACPDYVEFSHASFCRHVRYDVSSEEWEKLTGWKDQ